MFMKERVKQLCKEKGVSMNAAESEIGLAKGYISKLDNSNPNQKTLQKMSDYFGVSVEYLMTGKEPSIGSFSAQADLLIKIRNDKKLMDAIEKYYNLSEKKKTHILELIELLNEEA